MGRMTSGRVPAALVAVALLLGGAACDGDIEDSHAPQGAESADGGIPLDQIERDRPRSSDRRARPSLEELEREGGICRPHGTRADCADVPVAARPDALALWRRTVEFFPPAVLAHLDTFVLLPRGQGGGVAEDGRGSYSFSVGFPDDGNVDHVLIHELGHAFEVTSHREFFATWRDRYWSPADTRRVNVYAQRRSGSLADNPVYRAAPDRFVHPYAAASPSEDFAETFRWFVLGVKPTGDSVKEQKIRDLWADPDLVAARARIQQARRDHPGPLVSVRD